MAPACAVVTGGRGFLGRHMVKRLLDSSQWLVRILDLAPAIMLLDDETQLADALRSGKAHYIGVDLRDLTTLAQALENAEVVFHMAAPDSSINDEELHYTVNVVGTSNVIEACIQAGIKKLIYTSSPSVVFDFINGMKNADESTPYPPKHMDIYSATKAQGEALVLKANGKGGLLTCAIRPSGIFGPGDRLFLPSIAAAAKEGTILRFKIGNGENQFDWTYVENVVHGHICAEEALTTGAASDDSAAGKAFFITNCDPVPFWEFISVFLVRLGYELPRYRVPVSRSVALVISYVTEWICKQLGYTCRFTPSRVRYMSSWRTFSCDRACSLLKYRPIYSVEEGMNKTVDAFPQLRNPGTKIYSGRGCYLTGRWWWNAFTLLCFVLLVIGCCSQFFFQV